MPQAASDSVDSPLDICALQWTNSTSVYEELDLVEVDDELARRAGSSPKRTASAATTPSTSPPPIACVTPDLVVVAGDGSLLEAATVEGMAIAEVG